MILAIDAAPAVMFVNQSTETTIPKNIKDYLSIRTRRYMIVSFYVNRTLVYFVALA